MLFANVHILIINLQSNLQNITKITQEITKNLYNNNPKSSIIGYRILNASVSRQLLAYCSSLFRLTSASSQNVIKTQIISTQEHTIKCKSVLLPLEIQSRQPIPPVTVTVSPVMQEASDEHKKAITPPISSGSPTLKILNMVFINGYYICAQCSMLVINVHVSTSCTF